MASNERDCCTTKNESLSRDCNTISEKKISEAKSVTKISEICEEVQKTNIDASIEEKEHYVEKKPDVSSQESKMDEATKPAIKQGQYFSVATYDEFKRLLEDYYETTSSHFNVYKKSKHFGHTISDCDLFNHPIKWHEKKNPQSSVICFDMPFDGIPRMAVGVFRLLCQFGTNKKSERRTKRRDERREAKGIKKRKVKSQSKKCGCPAMISAKQVLIFPEYKIDCDSEARRKRGAEILRKDLRKNKTVQYETRIIGRFPDVSEHNSHGTFEGQEYHVEAVHKDIIKKIQDLYMQNYSTDDIMLACEEFVLKEMFYKQNPPDRKRRKFFPTRKDVSNCIIGFRNMCRCSKDAKKNIQDLIEQAKKDDENLNIAFVVKKQEIQEVETESSDDEFFEPFSNMKSLKIEKKTTKKPQKESTFLFCCQTPKQQRLLKRYGNVAFVVRSNGTSRTVPFQMYNVMVQTNVDYQTVCSMIISRQRKDGIKDGLTMLKDWNTYWRPTYFMVDCNKEIYDAVDEVFPDASYFLNPESCEDEWMKFLKSPSNDLIEQADEVMAFLKNMAYSFTEDSLTIAASLFEESIVWQNSSLLKTWFQTTWLHIAKKWVFAYRPENLLVTNHWKVGPNGCLKSYKEASVDISNAKVWLETVVKRLSTTIPEEDYKRYVNWNKELYKKSKRFEVNHPTSAYYHGIPVAILTHIYDVGKLAEENAFEVLDDQIGVFTVKYYPSLKVKKQEMRKRDQKSALKVVPPGKDSDIESLNTEFLQSGEFTVSFGDLCNYPYCSCPYWQMYKLPCVHMFAVFCKIPDWKYDMMSPLYRCENVFQFDYCWAEPKTAVVDFSCQTSISCSSVETQQNYSRIFIEPAEISPNENLVKQCNDFLQHFDKLSFLFNDKVLHATLRYQLKLLRASMQKHGRAMSDTPVVNKFKSKDLTKACEQSPSKLAPVIKSMNPSKLAPVNKSMQNANDKNLTIVKIRDDENETHILKSLAKANPHKSFTVVSKVVSSTAKHNEELISATSQKNETVSLANVKASLLRHDTLKKTSSRNVILQNTPKPKVFAHETLSPWSTIIQNTPEDATQITLPKMRDFFPTMKTSSTMNVMSVTSTQTPRVSPTCVAKTMMLPQKSTQVKITRALMTDYKTVKNKNPLLVSTLPKQVQSMCSVDSSKLINVVDDTGVKSAERNHDMNQFVGNASPNVSSTPSVKYGQEAIKVDDTTTPSEKKTVIKRNVSPFVGTCEPFDASSIAKNKPTIKCVKQGIIEVKDNTSVPIRLEQRHSMFAHNKDADCNKWNIAVSSSNVSICDFTLTPSSGIPPPQTLSKKTLPLKRTSPDNLCKKVSVMDYLPKLKRQCLQEAIIKGKNK